MSVDVLRSLLLFFSEDDFIVASGDLVVILGYKGFPGSSVSKESACNAGDLGSIPGLERSPGGRHGNPLQYSGLENPHG